MTVLLTGSTGFIGSSLIEIKNNFCCVVRENQKNDFNSTFSILNLDGETSWKGAFNHIDTVIHLAGLAHSNMSSQQDYQVVNVDGTLHLASEAAKSGVKRFIFVSTIGVNGNLTTNNPFSMKSTPHPHNDYARSKYDAEIGLKKIVKGSKMDLVIIRPTLVYGSNAPGNFGSLTRLVAKSPLLPFGLTNNRRHFISVQNLADLLVNCAIKTEAGGHTFLASEGGAVSIGEFTNAIAKGLDTNLIQLPVPVWLIRFAGKLLGKSAMVEQLVGHLEVDSSNLKEVLGWTPPYTMEESMAFLKQDK